MLSSVTELRAFPGMINIDMLLKLDAEALRFEWICMETHRDVNTLMCWRRGILIETLSNSGAEPVKTRPP